MTLHQLRIFSSVAKYQNVTRAAASLHISQPSVSQQLRLLEEEFHVKLYEKVGQGIRLTEAGANFRKKLDPILYQLAELERSFKAPTDAKDQATLTVGASYASAETLLPQVLASFREAHPGVRVHVHAARSALIEDAVLNEKVDVGLFYNPSHQTHHASLNYDTLGMEKVVFVASRSDPFLEDDEITPEQLRDLPIVVQKPRAGGDIPTRILDHLRQRGFSPNIVMQCESIHSVRVAVAGGAGIGFLVESTARVQHNNLRLVSVKDFDSFYLEACVVWRKKMTLSSPATKFLELLREVRIPSSGQPSSKQVA